MSYSIIGAGAVGKALAQAFARKDIEVMIASRQSPAALSEVIELTGAKVIPATIANALAADVVILAVPFQAHPEIARAVKSWNQKIVIDATNAFGIAPEELGDEPSSVVISRAFAGAQVVRAFNHLPARVLEQAPDVHGGRRVVFLSSDHENAIKKVSDLAEQLGFAPVSLGPLDQGSILIQARGNTWAPLMFCDLVKFA